MMERFKTKHDEMVAEFERLLDASQNGHHSAIGLASHPVSFSTYSKPYFDIVLGKLSGHQYTARPWYNGQMADFNFGDNLEVSFTRWSIFWGVGHPITLHSFKENIFSFNSTGDYTGTIGSSYGDRQDPGDRKSNFSFRWRLPYLSKLVTLYADAYSDDDPSPMAAPRRPVWNPGIYFARLPWLPHMDLRIEAVSSEGLIKDFGGGHFFINNQYLDGNTKRIDESHEIVRHGIDGEWTANLLR